MNLPAKSTSSSPSELVRDTRSPPVLLGGMLRCDASATIRLHERRGQTYTKFCGYSNTSVSAHIVHKAAVALISTTHYGKRCNTLTDRSLIHTYTSRTWEFGTISLFRFLLLWLCFAIANTIEYSYIKAYAFATCSSFYLAFYNYSKRSMAQNPWKPSMWKTLIISLFLSKKI